ncbi:serine hydrolase domain-containing protein [Methanogenium organophilum]|uniref:Serine hydrolase n=1 Tax=Methanogenium organophilum TaxID=2199 RepID=A0A9X9T7Q2_METOG|nr:serine hydrolase domain-containing protein [Methanogenium organophilum]WAI00342.1 serine hydrolase [Methanogenium organophilum]
MSPFRPRPLESIPCRMPSASLLCTVIIFILLTCPAVLAASATILPADGTGDLPEISNPADVQAFFDAAVPAGMAQYNIPGAVVAVVADGELVYANGYGYADIETQAPVDPEATLFHVGSITKLFTWTCVMKQVEKGTIDLDADVNTYLKDFSIPETYPGQPVTMRHLMTHSAGFEEEEIHFAVAEPADLYSYRIYCEENIPAIVYPPGTVSSYSNYGTTLAAVILEDVTGVPYDEYVQENILTPIGMTDTIVSYPEAPEADAITASGYHSVGGTNVAVPDTVFVIGPAGTISAPATDMAKFVAMHMENGTVNGAQILAADTALLMHAPAFANDPRVSSMCLGFYENHISDERIITHGGDTDTFHSLLVIIPERKAGYFVSYNSAGGNSARNDLLMAFVDHFYPVPETTEPEVTAETTTSADTYAGTYQSTRHNYRTFEFWLTPPQQMQVEAGEGEGTILMSRGGRPPVAYTEVEPGVFVQADGTETYAGNVVFREDTDGDVTFLCLENVPIMAFERVPWYGTNAAMASVRNLGIIILLSVFLWPLMAIGKYVYGPQKEESEKRNDEQDNSDIPFPFYARLLAGTASVLFILFVLFLLPAVTGDTALIQAYMLERTAPLDLGVVLSVPVIATILSIATAASAVFVWRKAYWTLWHRVHYTLITIGLFMLVWWVNYWNLFIFRM